MIRINAFKIAHSDIPGFFWSECRGQYIAADNGDEHSIYVNRSRAVGVAEEVLGRVVPVKRSTTWAEMGR